MKESKLSNKIPEYEFSGDDLNFEPLSSEVSHGIYTPEMVSIPKSEYELLIEIKDCFIGGKMTEKLGVLKSINGQYVDIDIKSGLCFGVDDFNNARHITRKEAEQFPQFKWVSLEDLK